jgi:raffinose/stachyose/melibiose transport system permease protein
MKNQSVFFQIIKTALLLIFSVLFIAPVFFIFINSFKPEESVIGSFYVLPGLHSFAGIENYLDALISTNIFMAFVNSFVVVFASVSIIIFLSSLAGWALARSNGAFSKLLLLFFIIAALIPFELNSFISSMLLNFFPFNRLAALIVIYISLALPINIFIYYLFIRKISSNIDEAALIDGSSTFSIFFKIITPILKPLTLVLSLLNSFLIWNDFFIAHSVLSGSFPVVPDAIYSFIHSELYNPAILSAVIVISFIATVIFYRRYNERVIKSLGRIK